MLHVGMIDGRGDKVHDIAARTAVSWRRGERLVLRPAVSLSLQLISARVAAVPLALASMRMIANGSLCRSCETFVHAARISPGRGTTTRRCHMKAKSVLSAGLGALALALVASAAQAAPAGGLAGAIDRDAAKAIEQVTWKRHWHCYWYHGYRRCYWGHRHYGWYRHHHHYRYW